MMSIEECVEVLEQWQDWHIKHPEIAIEREVNAVSLAIQILSRLNVEFIAKTLYDTKVKWEALEDFEKVALPKAGIKLYAEELVQALTNKDLK